MFEIAICIPTFNQPDMLEITLNSLLMQDSKEVQVIIHDGNYDNQNLKVVAKFENLLNIKYASNPGRTIDSALLDLIKISEAKYIWWFGDDVFNPGSLGQVLKFTKKGYDLIYVNGIISDSKKLLSVQDDKQISDKNVFLNLIGINIGFVSSFIFLREKTLGQIKRIENHMSKEITNVPNPTFSNVYIFLHVISSSNNLFLCSQPLFECQPHKSDFFLKTKVNDSGLILNDAFFVFGVNFTNILLLYKDQFDRGVIKSLNKSSFKSAWRGVIVGSALGWDTTKKYKGYSKKLALLRNYYNQPEILLALPLFLLPKGAIKFLYTLFKQIKR